MDNLELWENLLCMLSEIGFKNNHHFLKYLLADSFLAWYNPSSRSHVGA